MQPVNSVISYNHARIAACFTAVEQGGSRAILESVERRRHIIYCPYNDDECRCGDFCIASVWSTPKNPDSHTRALRRMVEKCSSHQRRYDTESEEGSASIWHLAEILGGLKARAGYQIDTCILEIAQVTLDVNITKEVIRHPMSRRDRNTGGFHIREADGLSQ